VNAKCEKYFSLEFPKQAFIDSWEDESCWMNPPYGRDIYGWVLKAYMESKDTRAMVGLLPARTDTSWWHEFVYNKRVHVSFIRGRLKFEGARNSAPFPSAIVVWQCNDFSPISKADQILRVEAIARHPKDFQKAFAGAA
jgi:site-specific DNA-methyltransferase (adenine-specific)